MTTAPAVSSLYSNANAQDACPLFTVLPPEIRTRIFELALASSEDLVKKYPRNALWNRPGHYGPRTTYSELLRTSKRVYQEAWYMPSKDTSLTIYLAAWDRRPAVGVNPFELEEQLKHVSAPIEFEQLEIFAQAYMLEPGPSLQNVLDIPNLLPKRVTITLRRTDFWFWESDDPLRIKAQWVRECRFPESVREITVNFETVEQRRIQADWLANAACRSWYFQRTDGPRLRPVATAIEKWTGTSTINVQRYFADEARPGQIDFHIASVTFQAPSSSEQLMLEKENAVKDPQFSRRKTLGGPDLQLAHDAPPDLEVPEDVIAQSMVDREDPVSRLFGRYIPTATLKRAGVPGTATVTEADGMIMAARRHRAAERRVAEGIPEITQSESQVWDSDIGDYVTQSQEEQDGWIQTDDEDDTDGQVPAPPEDDDRHGAGIVTQNLESDLTFLPGYPRSIRARGGGKFGGDGTGYQYQFWRKRYLEWRSKAVKMSKEDADKLRLEMMPFWIPRQYATVDPEEVQREVRAAEDLVREHGPAR